MADPEILNPESTVMQQSQGMWQKYLALVLFKLSPNKSIDISIKDMERFEKFHAQNILAHGHAESIEFSLVDDATAKRLAKMGRGTVGRRPQLMPIQPENRDRYPADWALRSRFVRYYRAKNCCEWCGAKNGQPHPITGSIVVLTTAHVFDKAPEAAGLLNLAALCQRCHLNHDRDDHIANRQKNIETRSGQQRLIA